MRTETVSFEDRSVEVVPPAIHEHGDDVCEVIPHDDYSLSVRFFDGVSGNVKMRDMIFGDGAGVFAALRDHTEFAKVGISLGAVTWDNGLDLAPDAMHEELAGSGVWTLR